MHISIASVVANELVTAVYQPVFDLDTGEISGYEAFARGPKGTVLERPADMFAAADRAGVRNELEWVCRASALRRAVEAGLDRSTCLYLNIEPTTVSTDAPPHLAAEIAAAAAQLHVVAELSEQDVTRDPASLIRTVSGMRGLGFEIGIDDLGSNNNALSLVPFLQPDVIKLDVGLLSVASSEALAATAAAVHADVDRRGSIVVAERVETEEQLDLAVVMGARHAQGWLFSAPAALRRNDVITSCTPHQRRQRASAQAAPASPFALVENSDRLRVGTKSQLLAMSRAIEDHPLSRFDRPVLLASFQHESNFDTSTLHRYAGLADHHAFVGVVGRRFDAAPYPGLRGGAVPSGHPAGRDWAVARIGPHFAAALIAQEINCGAIRERDRRFAFLMTHDRPLVVAAATSLLQLIEPLD